MDRDRLEQVHQTDLTESRVNEDFIVWLKTKAPTYLLAILIGLAAFMGVIKWREYRNARHDAAWRDLQSSQLPASLLDVASEHSGETGVKHLARLGAAQYYLRSVQTGLQDPLLGGDDTAPDAEPRALTEEERSSALDRADGLYADVLADDDDSVGMTVHMVSALYGRAAVAESRGDLANARSWYEQAGVRQKKFDERLSGRADLRIETMDTDTVAFVLPSRDDLPQDIADLARPNPLGGAGVPSLNNEFRVDPALRDLIFPDGL